MTEKKQMIEIQIRTQEMHDLAENGISAHWHYKDLGPKSKMKDDKRLLWLREMVEMYKEQKSPREFLQSLKTDLIPEEVFVYTPKGKTMTLPLGASALDFAFKIHSEIGLHAVEAKVNGRITPLKTFLKAGDVVEIITSPKITPDRRWLNMVFTPTARHHLKHWLNLQDKTKSTELGQKLWEKESEKYLLPLKPTNKPALLNNFNNAFNYRVKTIKEFYGLIGSGKIVLNRKFMEKLFSQKDLPEKKETILDKVVTKVKTKPKSTIPVKDTKGRLVQLAKCCSPINGEPIKGYMTSGRGLTIHALRCLRLQKYSLDEQRLVDVSWDKTKTGFYKGAILIKGEDSPGVLAKLTSTIAQLGGNISKAEVKTFSDKKAQIKLSLRIKDIAHFQRIMKKITKIKEIDSVERI